MVQVAGNFNRKDRQESATGAKKLAPLGCNIDQQ